MRRLVPSNSIPPKTAISHVPPKLPSPQRLTIAARSILGVASLTLLGMVLLSGRQLPGGSAHSSLRPTLSQGL